MNKEWNEFSREEKLKYYQLDKKSLEEFNSRKVKSKYILMTEKFFKSLSSQVSSGYVFSETLDQFLLCGADVNDKTVFEANFGFTCLEEVIVKLFSLNNVSDTIALLIRAGLDLSDEYLVDEILLEVIKNKKYEYLELLLLGGLDPNHTCCFDQCSILCSLIIEETIEGVRILVSYGADPEVCDSHLDNAFDYANEIKDDDIRNSILEILNKKDITNVDKYRENCKKIRKIFNK